jgi:Fe-S cluster assembly ATP-binding protein
MLTLTNVSASVGTKKILSRVSLRLMPGTIACLMGPNGSGKSTLASVILGHPDYRLARGSKIDWKGRSITRLSPSDRAKRGIFLSFQNPLPLPGVSVKDLLRVALEGRLSAVELAHAIERYAKELHIKPELLTRSLNDGFSGGEKKKLEALQAVLLEPKLAILDELDTGVDVDAIKTISRFLKKHLPKDASILYITHSTRLEKYLRPDRVFVMKEGSIVRTGTRVLAERIERHGFDWIKNKS